MNKIFSLLQIAHYNSTKIIFKGQRLDFNLGTVSSILDLTNGFGTVSSILDITNATFSSELYFDVYMDISKYLYNVRLQQYSRGTLQNNGRRRRRRRRSFHSAESLGNNTAATMTHFKVSTETSCNVLITTQSGETNMHFVDGEIENWTGHSVRNVSSHVGHVLVTYHLVAYKIDFQCQCVNEIYNCSSTYFEACVNISIYLSLIKENFAI